MRGDPIVKKASELTEAELKGAQGTLCLWGDPKGNSVLSSFIKQLPLQWSEKSIALGGKTFDAATHVPVLASRVRSTDRSQIIVINSGLTFREAHDKTNSLQNPKLPDWAVLDVSQGSNQETAGKVVLANFFDSRWKVK